MNGLGCLPINGSRNSCHTLMYSCRRDKTTKRLLYVNVMTWSSVLVGSYLELHPGGQQSCSKCFCVAAVESVYDVVPFSDHKQKIDSCQLIQLSIDSLLCW